MAYQRHYRHVGRDSLCPKDLPSRQARYTEGEGKRLVQHHTRQQHLWERRAQSLVLAPRLSPPADSRPPTPSLSLWVRQSRWLTARVSNIQLRGWIWPAQLCHLAQGWSPRKAGQVGGSACYQNLGYGAPLRMLVDLDLACREPCGPKPFDTPGLEVSRARGVGVGEELAAPGCQGYLGVTWEVASSICQGHHSAAPFPCFPNQEPTCFLLER